MSPLDILLGRIIAGEKFKKASPGDWRFGFGVLLWFSFTVTVLVRSASSFMNEASGFVIWLSLTLWLVLGWGFAEVCRRYVPAIIPIVLTITTWVLYFLF